MLKQYSLMSRAVMYRVCDEVGMERTSQKARLEYDQVSAFDIHKVYSCLKVLPVDHVSLSDDDGVQGCA
jgi:hypothetical protein